LVESTAEVFRRATAGHPPAVPAVAAGALGFGQGVAAGVPGTVAPMTIRRSLPGSMLAGPAPHASSTPSAAHADLRAMHTTDVAGVPGEPVDISRLPAREFHQLVDAVVEAIEQRVVDELERRGRRHPGVF
jgi:hypothetical protein